MISDRPLGVSLHTLARLERNVYRLDEALVGAVLDSGIRTLELAQWMFEENPDSIRMHLETLLKHDMRVETVHAEFASADISCEDADARSAAVCSVVRAVDLAESFDAPTVVLHSSGEPIDPACRERRMACAQESLRSIADVCAAKQKQLAIEFLPRSCLGNCYEDLKRLAEAVDGAAVGFCLDTNHLMDKPAILPDLVARMGKQLIATHLSDYDGIDEKHWVPGTGVIDWAAFMHALRAAKYAGPFNFECSFDTTLSVPERIAQIEQAYAMLIEL